MAKNIKISTSSFSTYCLTDLLRYGACLTCPGDHDVCSSGLDEVKGVSDGVSAGGAGCGNTVSGSLHTELHRNVTGVQVGQDLGYKVGTEFPSSAASPCGRVRRPKGRVTFADVRQVGHPVADGGASISQQGRAKQPSVLSK